MEAFKGQLDRARGGEPEALSALYRQLLPGVFGSIAARVPDRATAEDLTSDVFLQMVATGMGIVGGSLKSFLIAFLRQGSI